MLGRLGDSQMKHHELQLKVVVLAGVAALSLLFLTSTLQRPAHDSFSGLMYPQYGVTILWEVDAVAVTIDGREERVPKDQLANSPIYQEAISRIPRSDRPAISEVRWERVLRYWIPLNVLTWWLLFRGWQPSRPYMEGPRV